MNGPDDYIAETVNFEDGDDHWFTQRLSEKLTDMLNDRPRAGPRLLDIRRAVAQPGKGLPGGPGGGKAGSLVIWIVVFGCPVLLAASLVSLYEHGKRHQ